MAMMPIALTIAGSDSGGGAGIQADLKTFAAFEVYGVSVITAVTAQNTRGVRSVSRVDLPVIRDQLDAVAEDFSIGALKTGMLDSVDVIGVVAEGIRRHRLPHLVVDPVMVAKSGDRLLQPGAGEALRRQLLPLAEVVTPNLPEAEVLAEQRIVSIEDRISAARVILQLGARGVLIKGGHGEDDPVIDLYVDGQGVHEFRAPRRKTTSTHGTGCTLSAAIAAGLARHESVARAIEQAHDYLQTAMASAPGLGHGHGPLNHFARHPVSGPVQ
jgi:hydroxymethylpyrimidine/phosphomethylpyrimidine kinase